jgi:hypothetical protein
MCKPQLKHFVAHAEHVGPRRTPQWESFAGMVSLQLLEWAHLNKAGALRALHHDAMANFQLAWCYSIITSHTSQLVFV